MSMAVVQVVLTADRTWELAVHTFTLSMFVNVCAVVVHMSRESTPVIACAAGLDLRASYESLNALKVWMHAVRQLMARLTVCGTV